MRQAFSTQLHLVNHGHCHHGHAHALQEVEKLFRMTKFTTEEGILRFTKRLRKMGIDDKLEELGAQEGDIVKILDFAFEYRK